MKLRQVPCRISTTHDLAATAMTHVPLRVFHVAQPGLCYLKANTALMVVLQQQLSTPPAQHFCSKTISVKQAEVVDGLQAAVHSGSYEAARQVMP